VNNWRILFSDQKLRIYLMCIAIHPLFLPVLRTHPKEDEKTTVDTDCHFGVQFYAATAVIRPGKSGNLRR
jgi:hypothetical protein